MKTTTRKPWQRNGSTGFTNDLGRWVCTGSQMGRRNILPDNPNEPCQLRMERLNFGSDCYDAGGAYWGFPANLWCAYGDAGEVSAEVYVRADSREQAKAGVRESLPGATFYR